MTMETESHGHVLFRVTRGNTSGTCIETRFNLFQSVSSRTNTHYFYIIPLVSVCSSRHGLKQNKLCFNSRASCEAALRSDRRLCLQSYYLPIFEDTLLLLMMTLGDKVPVLNLSCTYPLSRLTARKSLVLSLRCSAIYRSKPLGASGRNCISKSTDSLAFRSGRNDM